MHLAELYRRTTTSEITYAGDFTSNSEPAPLFRIEDCSPGGRLLTAADGLIAHVVPTDTFVPAQILRFATEAELDSLRRDGETVNICRCSRGSSRDTPSELDCNCGGWVLDYTQTNEQGLLYPRKWSLAPPGSNLPGDARVFTPFAVPAVAAVA